MNLSGKGFVFLFGAVFLALVAGTYTIEAIRKKAAAKRVPETVEK